MDGEREYILGVEKRYLEVGGPRLLIVVPTREQTNGKLECLNDLVIPVFVKCEILNVYGMSVDDAYNFAIQYAIDHKFHYILTVEDDTFPPANIFSGLLEHMRQNPTSVVGAWYPRKTENKEGAHIHINKDGERQSLAADGKVHEVYTIAMGCTLYPIEVFKETPYPWFKKTTYLTQDSFFSQVAREAGYKLYVDTNLKCKHVDIKTGKVYE